MKPSIELSIQILEERIKILFIELGVFLNLGSPMMLNGPNFVPNGPFANTLIPAPVKTSLPRLLFTEKPLLLN